MKHPHPPRASRPPLEGATGPHEDDEPSPSAYSPEIEALTRRLRTLIRETVPTAEERIYKDGRSAGYHEPRCGAFCGLFPRRDAVYVAFPKGHLLPDETGLLSGTEGRYAILHPEDAFPEEALFKLFLAAVLIGGDRAR